MKTKKGILSLMHRWTVTTFDNQTNTRIRNKVSLYITWKSIDQSTYKSTHQK